MNATLKILKDDFPSFVHLFHSSINNSIVIIEAFDAANISFSLCFPLILLSCSNHNVLNNSTYFKLEETEALKGKKKIFSENRQLLASDFTLYNMQYPPSLFGYKKLHHLHYIRLTR